LARSFRSAQHNDVVEALYIQNFNIGMKDAQFAKLGNILRDNPSIWAINVGEIYQIENSTWEAFADCIEESSVTHMYASEHTITGVLKDRLRDAIRKNRSKHNRHIDPNNIDVIQQITHCWWNPINAKILRPYIKNNDLGLLGSR
tara:strand:- start:406 stop:840 length:435 start_codon:yes stop_codon:yes gene_type:complete